MSRKRKLVCVVENHFDQIWRRCFKRNIEWNGINYIPYAKIEQYYVDENLKLAEKYPDYKFQIENICAVETYLESCPENEPVIRELYKKGNLKTTNTGYVILDSNMISIEAIIRNYLISDVFFKKYMGKTPDIANRSDAFGNSAQLPQILKAFGAKYVTEIYYNPVDRDVWTGLDKTSICVTDRKMVGGAGGWSKNPPCPACRGYGEKDKKVCPQCNGRGIDESFLSERYREVNLWPPEETADGILRCGGEEILPKEDTIHQIEKLRKETGHDITLGHWDFLLELFKEQIEKVEKGDFTGLKTSESPEFNPNTTGGYTSRIKIKQRLCETENKILAGETLEAMGMIKGQKPFSYDTIWRKFLLNGFHDSAYGTIVDKGYEEIMDMFVDIDNVAKNQYLASDDGQEVCLFNPTSHLFNGVYEASDGRLAIVKDMKPYSFAKVKYAPAGERKNAKPHTVVKASQQILTGKADTVVREESDSFTIENQYFIVEADDKGIKTITDKKTGVICREIDGKRPCEWLLEGDNGSPWATLEAPTRCDSLKDYTVFEAIEESDFYTKICFKTDIPMTIGFVPSAFSFIKWSLTLFKESNKIRFNVDMGWYTSNKRLMMVFPTLLKNTRDMYGIPGGRLERAAYEPDYSWNGASGDWPAFRWGGVENESQSIAILNRGTPAYKILPASEGKIIYLTLLRSPANPVCLHEPDAYTMNQYDGMRDEGAHSFVYELASYNTSFENSTVERDAEQFSRPLLAVNKCENAVEMPVVTDGTAFVTHIKPAEDLDGVIVRVTETLGKDGKATISVPSWVKKIYKTDMPERKREELVFGKELILDVRGFEIATLRFCK